MVQIVQEHKRRSTSDKFADAFENVGQALPDMLKEFQKSQQQHQQSEAEKELGIDPRLSPEIKKMIYQYQLMGNLEEAKGRNQINLLNQKQSAGQEENNQTREMGQKAFNQMASILNKENVGPIAKGKSLIPFIGSKEAEDIGKFGSLTGGLESMLVEMVNKGTLSNTRFNYITETLLPKPTDRIDTIRGKLKGLAEILGLDASALEGMVGNGENKSSNNISARSFDRRHQ
jgi:hypothetical protein